MASKTVDVVRITQRELENIAGNMSRNTGTPHQRDDTSDRRRDDHMVSRQRKEKKRPDIPLYRPGMSRLSRRTSPGTQSDQSEESSSGTEISPPKSVKPPALMSLVVEKSDVFKQTKKGTPPDSSSSKPPVNQPSPNVSSGGRGGKKSSVNRPSQQKTSEKGGKRENVSHGEDWESDVSSTPPAQSGKHRAKETTTQASTQDARRKEQQETKSRRGGEQSKTDTKPKAHKEQLKVKIGEDVKEPAQISPTTIELIKTWKGDQSDIKVAKKLLKEDIQAKTTPKAESISISKGKGPLRTEDNKSELSAVMYSPKPQRHKIQTSRKQGREEDRKEKSQEEVSRVGSGDHTDERVHQKKEQTGGIVTGTGDNAAEWDWVKELMNEEPPATPKFYHGKSNEDNSIEVRVVHSIEPAEAQSSKQTDNESRSLSQEIGKSQSSRTDEDRGMSQHNQKQEKQKTSRDEKQGVAGGGRDGGGGGGRGRVGVNNRRQQEDEWENDLIEVDESKLPKAASVPLQPEHESKEHSRSQMQVGNRTNSASANFSERKQPVIRDNEKKAGRYAGSRGTDTRQDSSHRRPERDTDTRQDSSHRRPDRGTDTRQDPSHRYREKDTDTRQDSSHRRPERDNDTRQDSSHKRPERGTDTRQDSSHTRPERGTDTRQDSSHRRPERDTDTRQDSSHRRPERGTDTRQDSSHRRPERATDTRQDSSHKRPERATDTRQDSSHRRPERGTDTRQDSSHKRPDRATDTIQDSSHRRPDRGTDTRQDSSHRRPERDTDTRQDFSHTCRRPERGTDTRQDSSHRRPERGTDTRQDSSHRRPERGTDTRQDSSHRRPERGTDTRQDSSHSKRPERAIYVAPKRPGQQQSDHRHEVDEDIQRRENRQRHDTRYNDHDDRDVQEDDDIVSRKVAVSPNKKDLTITVKTDNSKESRHKEESGTSTKRCSSQRSRQRFNSGSSTGSESHQAEIAMASDVGKHEDDIGEMDEELENFHLDHAYKESLRDSVSSVDSDRERSTKEAGRRSRHRYDDDDDVDEPQNSRVPSELVFNRTESGRAHDHPRNESRKSKHLSVKFSKDVHETKHQDDDNGSDSEGNARLRAKDVRSRSDHRDMEHRRKQRERRLEGDTYEHHAKGGGLLKLPGSMHLKSEPRAIPARSDAPPGDHSAYSPYYDKHYPAQGQSPSNSSDDRHKPDSRSRGADRSRLWDPSKPQKKPALPEKHAEKDELHFYDPEEEQSRADRASPSDPRNPYPYHYPPGYGPYYPGYQPIPQSYFPQGYYPSQQQPAPTPSTSWAEQVDNATHGLPITPPAAAYPAPSYGHFPPLSSAVASSDPYQVASQEIPGSGHQSVHQQSAMRLLREATGMDIELTNLLSRGLRGNECIDRAVSIQHDLEKVCEKLLLLDLDACNKYNVEQLLWKSAYYQLIEALRKQQDPIGVFKEYLMNLLDHGNEFYKGVLSKLESGYKFSLENYSGMDPLREEKRRSVKLALLSAQRCMIALGDIARYKELANDTSNYGQARSWYLKAQQLVPRNGRPYNQLAILALYTRRKLDAVYYYMRSLAASNQFLTARESLMSLFEEVRKKSHHKEQEELRIRREKEQAKAVARRNKARKFLQHDEDQWRQEVWVSHDGIRSDAKGDVKEEEQDEEAGEMAKLKKLSPVDVNKKFVLSFLNAHGKLFTNIGMEAFPHVIDKLLREFSVLLTHSPPPINSTRLLQLMAINMYAAHHTQRQEPEAENMRSLQQEQAVQLGLDMFGLLVARCTTILKDHIAHNPKETHMLHEDLHEFLPGIKVYADWMMCHMALWNPPPNCTEMPYRAAVDVWKVLAAYFNIVDNINTSAVSFIKQQPEDCIEIRLPEDLALSGFVPLMTLPLQPVFVPAGTDKIVAMDCTRINSLRFFAEFLCGLEMPLLAYRKSKGGFFSVAPEYLHADPEADVVEALDEDDDVIIEDYTEEDEGESTEADRDINRLRERKEDLERKLKQQQRKKAQIEAIVDSHRHQRKMEIEIRPLYLIPDTNCFIDHLLTIQMLVSCKRYTLVVPIVVINELDGLAKGSREGQYSDPIHAYQVQSGANSAMQYLEDQFERGNKHVRALTGKGTIMDTITFRSEESGNKGNNDDLILRCCLHYCEDKARDFMPHDKDSPIHLLREVVLLTNDRNLRVKALNQNVPVRDVVSFIKWAKV